MIASLHLLIKLVIAHLLGDFFLQPRSWVNDRNLKHHRSVLLYLHAGIHALLAYVLMWDWKRWYIPVIIFVTHWLIDWVKSYQKEYLTRWFIIDQVLHLLVICAVWRWLLIPKVEIDLFAILSNTQGLYTITAYLILARPTSIFIGIATHKWRKSIENDKKETLKDAGAWIGIIERYLILTFIIVGQDGAIGFLMAAKSIFRFGDLSQLRQKNQTEYLVIGTFLSFGIAIVVGYVLRQLGMK